MGTAYSLYRVKSCLGEIDQNLKVFLSIKCYEIRINKISNLQKLQKLIRFDFIFVNKSF